MAVTVEHLRAVVDADTKKARAELKSFQEHVKRLASRGYSIALDVDTAGAKPEMTALETEIKALTAKKHTVNIDVDTSGVAAATGELGLLSTAAQTATDGGGGVLSAGGGGGIKGLTGATEQLSSVASLSVGSLAKMGAMVVGVGAAVVPAVTAISSLVAGATGLVSALAPLSGLLATLPQGFAALGQGASAALLGFKSLAAAYKSLDTAKTFQEEEKALARLTPAMSTFVQLLRNEVMPQFRAIQQAAGEGLLSGVTAGLKDVMPLMSMFRDVIGQTSQAIGRQITKFTQFASSAPFTDDFRTIASSNLTLIDRFGDTVVSLTSAITHLMVAAKPLTEWLGDATARWAEGVNQWMAAGRESGRLANFFERTRSVAERLGSILGGLLSTLAGIGKAAAPLGDWLLKGFDNLLKTTSEWLSKSSNMTQLKGYFDSFKEPLSAMGRLIRGVYEAWLDLTDTGVTTRLLDSITNDLLPAVVQFGHQFEELGPKIVSAVGDMASILTKLSDNKGLETLVGAIASLANSIDNLLSKGSALGGFAKTVAGFALGPVTAIDNVRNAVDGLFGSATAGASQAARPTMAFRDVVSTLTTTFGISERQATKWTQRYLEMVGPIDNASQAVIRYKRSIDELIASQSKTLGDATADMISVMAQVPRYQKAAADATRQRQDAEREYNKTLRDSVVDTRALASAQESAADAATNLAESYAEAERNLRDLRFASRRSILSEARAINSLQDAYDRLGDIQKGVGRQTQEITRVTDDFTGKIYEVTRITGDAADSAEDQRTREKQLRDALLDVAEAQLAVDEAKASNIDTQLKLADAERKGIAQSDVVVAAQRRLRDANYAVTDAIKAQKRAAEDNAEAIYRAARRVADAKANEKVAYSDLTNYLNGPVKKSIADVAAAADALNKTVRLKVDITLNEAAQKIFDSVLAVAGNVVRIWGGDTKSIAPMSLGSRATGGPVYKGQTYMVGEEGRELFTPAQDGYITPNATTEALMRNGGSKDSLTAAQIEALVTAVVDKIDKPDITQVFNEKVDPVHMGAQLSWELRK